METTYRIHTVGEIERSGKLQSWNAPHVMGNKARRVAVYPDGEIRTIAANGNQSQFLGYLKPESVRRG